MDGFDRIGKPGAPATPVHSTSAEEQLRTMGRVALITGASLGIGAATALVLAKQGYRVVPEDAVREISDGIKSRIRFNAVVETGVPGFIPRGT